MKDKGKDKPKKIKTSLSQPVRAAMIALSVLQIIFGLIMCFTSKMASEALSSTFQESIEDAEVIYEDEEMQKTYDKTISDLGTIFENSWILFIFNGTIIVVANIFILVWGIQEKLLIKKPKVITLCAISLAFSNSYNIFFSIVSLIIAIAAKRKIPEDFGNKQKKLKVKFDDKK